MRARAARAAEHLRDVNDANAQIQERLANLVDVSEVEKYAFRLAGAQMEGNKVRATVAELQRAVDTHTMESALNEAEAQSLRAAAERASADLSDVSDQLQRKHGQCIESAGGENNNFLCYFMTDYLTNVMILLNDYYFSNRHKRDADREGASTPSRGALAAAA